MGYSDMQRHELEETIRRTPCDLVLIATPIDLARVIKIDKPNLRVTLPGGRAHRLRACRNCWPSSCTSTSRLVAGGTR